jgi:diguanylate cyclase (GGDEF)-like protein
MTNDPQNKLLFNEDELFQIFTSLFDIVYLMKHVPPHDFMYVKVSDSAKKLASLTDDDIGKTISEVFHHPVSEQLNKHYLGAVQKNGPISFRDRMNSHKGEKYGESVLIPFEYENEWYVVGLTRDITHVVNLEQKQANDPITGLPFAENFTSMLSLTLRLKKFHGSIWNMYYISINKLSFIQYTKENMEAHLLKQIASRLKRFLKNEDLLSRVSGNEFVMAIRAHKAEECEELANQIYESLLYPYKTEDYETVINSAIGVSVINADTLDIQASMADAFQAMLRAKSKADKQIVLPFDKNWSDDGRRYTLERDIAYAVKRNELELYYQPKLDIRKNKLNVEALLRWKHHKIGMIAPNEFIPLAEKTHLIKSIGKWVINQVCKDIKQFQKINPDITAAINVSPVQLNDNQFIKDLNDIVKNNCIDPSQIELEITENDLLNISSAKKQFDDLAQEGYQVVLDDFGTSYSSLNYLKELSVHKLKIDKSFIMNMDYMKKDEQIVQMIIKLAKNLDLEVTAEGVEKWAHVEMLTKMDCNEIQGYYLSKPLPINELLRKMKENLVKL